MQQSPVALLLGLVLIILLVGSVVLLVADPAPPAQTVEKELDAKAFLKPKQ